MDSLGNLCTSLHTMVWRLPRHRFPIGSAVTASNGVYFLFETGESAHGGDRIVRVGSHTGPDNLRSRLNEHTTENKDRSIFRKNIGRALLSKANDSFLMQWERDLTARADRDLYGGSIDSNKLAAVERSVTEYIVGHFSMSFIQMDDNHAALEVERLCIATVAQCPECRPSKSWLGNFSPKPKIQRYGLWQEQHVSGIPLTADEFRRVEQCASAPTRR